MSDNLRDKSKKGFTSDSNTLETINCGSFQRIADACELMASNYKRLQSENESMKAGMQYRNDRIEKLERKVSAYKGVITKLKKKSPPHEKI
jgi:hypothetical protein